MQQHKFKTSGVLFYFALSDVSLIGFSISKNLGCAVLRNRFKRNCRALCLSNKNNQSVLLVVRPLLSLKKIENLPLCFDRFYKFVGCA